MKAIILILLLFPSLFSAAQEEQRKGSAPIKPSTTDCPTWNKKDRKSKADYFQYLRTSKKNVNQQATNNPYNYRDSKIQPNSVPQKAESSNRKLTANQSPEITNKEKVEVLKSPKTEKASPVISKESNPVNLSAEDKKTNKTPEKKPAIENEKEKPVASKVSSEEKTADKKAPEVVTGNGSKTEVKENKKEDNKIKKKLERMSRKTTKVRRHSNSKCPSF